MAVPASTQPSGVYAAVLTPLNAALEPDPALFVQHCRWLLDNGCDGLAPLGTTGEANSLSVEQRIALIEAAAGSGIPMAKFIPGSGSCALADAVKVTRAAVKAGAAGALLLPPFYYKNPTEDGLFAFFSEVIERVGDARLRVYLYHFPQLSTVPITHHLIARLMKAFPGTIAGLKDSSGDWNSTKEYLDAFPGWGLFTGWDPHLREVVRLGGAGTISGMPNINMVGLRALYDNRTKPEGAELEATATTLIKTVDAAPPTAGLRAVLAHYTGKESWLIRRPPLVQDRDQENAVVAAIRATGFKLPPPLKPGE